MNRRIAFLICGLVVIALSMTVQSKAQSGGEQKTVWSGVYSDEGAVKGQALYEQYCVNCHGMTLGGSPSSGGPPLAGEKFMENWREDNVESLFLKIRNTMPRRGFQGNDKRLTENETLDLISFIFKRNDFPAGAEAKTAGLSDIRIERKEGPKPLPNYSQVQVVGCMQQEAENWVLLQASQPTRLRGSGETIAPEVLKAAAATPLGNLKIRVQNFTMLGAFKPEDYKGHKMVAQGALIRQGGIDRVSVTQLQSLSASCTQ
jgi:mono/diheme cytochrome c family protein